MPSIGIVVIATNGYFPLGMRLVKQFEKHRVGEADIRFHIFADRDPSRYLPSTSPVKWHEERHSDWLRAVRSKFHNICQVATGEDRHDYVFYVDADTAIRKDFRIESLLGDLVGAQHFDDWGRLRDDKPFDRNPQSSAFVPFDTPLPQMYFHAAFFGGTAGQMASVCALLGRWQDSNRELNHEPPWNDESYLNAYLHAHPPTKTIHIADFPFVVSDQGGCDIERRVDFDIQPLLVDLETFKESPIDIVGGRVTEIQIAG